MSKFDKFGKYAEKLFVENFLSLVEIEKKIGVSTRTLGKWKKEYNWEKKQLEHQKELESLTGKMTDIADNILTKIQDFQEDPENNNEPSKADLYLLDRILPKIKTTFNFETQKKQAEESKTESKEKKGLSKENREKILRELYGIEQ